MERKSKKNKNKEKKRNKSKSSKGKEMGSKWSADAAVVVSPKATPEPKKKIMPLTKEAIDVFEQFPTDVLEEIFVRLMDMPASRNASSTWKVVSQVCKSWNAINTSKTFWYKATMHYFPDFVASDKHDPQISFMQEFKKLAVKTYDMKTMGITWLNEQYWRTETNEGEIRTSDKDLKDDMPSNIFPCKNVLLPHNYAKLSSVCWLDVRTYATVSYPCTAKLLVCLKLVRHSLGPLNIDINAGIKSIADDEPKWQKLTGFVWGKEDQEACENGEWVYLDLGTVDAAHIKDHGLETIELQGQIWSHSGDWKSGLYISHLKCIQLPKH